MLALNIPGCSLSLVHTLATPLGSIAKSIVLADDKSNWLLPAVAWHDDGLHRHENHKLKNTTFTSHVSSTSCFLNYLSMARDTKAAQLLRCALDRSGHGAAYSSMLRQHVHQSSNKRQHCCLSELGARCMPTTKLTVVQMQLQAYGAFCQVSAVACPRIPNACRYSCPATVPPANATVCVQPQEAIMHGHSSVKL